MSETMSRVVAEISLSALEKNFESMHQKLGAGVKMIAVIKTDGYGHGAREIAHLVEDYEYIWGFATASVEEAMELRESGIRKPILLLGFSFPDSYRMIAENEIRPAVFKLSMAEQLSEAGRAAGKTVRIHIALDTGMSRIGFQVREENADLVKKIQALPNIEIEGMFTHFARADEKDKAFSREQFDAYQRFSEMLKERGVEIPLRHVGNSACIMELPDYQLDAVRAGITIYGIYPSDEVDREKLRLEPVMSLKSRIVYIKTLPEGVPVSYGGTFVTERETRIATVAAGYGDGYPRMLSGKAEVLIRGRRAPILGRVCMDQFMVDVTDIPAEEFDLVTLLGKDGDEEITADELGKLSGRFPYELVSCISKRVKRVFKP